MNITELKALAEKATPGPWLHEKENVHTGGVCSVNQGGEPWFEVWSPNWMDAPAKNNEADAAYIAAANPAEILELIAQLEDAQGEIRALRATEQNLRDRLAQVEAEHAALLKAISDAEPVACSHFTDEQISRSMNGTGLWVYATRGEPLYTLEGIRTKP